MKKIILASLLLLASLILSAQSFQRAILDHLRKADKEYSIFEEEHDKEMTEVITGKGADKERMYNALLATFYQYDKAAILSRSSSVYINDSIIAERLMIIRPHLVNAGMYYNEKKEYIKASDVFLAHWDYERMQPFLQRHNIVIERDSTNATINFYAIVCSMQIGYTSRSIELLNRLISEPYIENSTYNESDLYEYLAVQYESEGNQQKWTETLKKGMQKFPDNKYFTPTLVNAYLWSKKWEAAISLIKQMIKDKPEEYSTLMPVIGSIYMEQKKYKQAEKIYKAILKKDKNNLSALEGLGRMHALMAQDKKEEILMATSKKQIIKLEKEATKRYKKALSYLEKQYKLLSDREKKDKDALRKSLLLLQNVYYNLALYNAEDEEEYDKITNLLDELQD